MADAEERDRYRPSTIAGLPNNHPRSGMAFNASDSNGKIVQLYDRTNAEA